MLEELRQENKVEAKRLKAEQSSDLKEKEGSGCKEVSSVTSVKTENSSNTLSTEIAEATESAQPPPRRKANIQV